MHASLRDRRRSDSVAFTATRRTVGALAALGLMALLPAAASADTFSFTGAEQSYLVPAGVTAVHVEATGAAGAAGASPGGRGATVSGTVAVTPAQTLYVEVGGVGQCNGSGGGSGDGGGGADVRTVSAADGGGSFCVTPFNQSATSLNSRLIVAGAGGGGGTVGGDKPGGDAGQAAPGGAPAGQAGTDSAGGAGGAASPPDAPGAPGTLGAGGQGDAPFGTGAGGGGGGLYGGGGGALIFSPGLISYGGGGGSSLVPAGGSGPAITTDPASVEITPCTKVGTAAGEKLGGTAGNDVICGLGGNDRINGKGGDDVLFGEAGDDDLIGEGGADTLDGGDGFDTADYKAGASQGVNVNLTDRVALNDGRGFTDPVIASVERVEGAKSQQNTLSGDAGPNTLVGGLLADFIQGGEGADLLRGEPDHASSGAGDTLLGNEGSDEIFPGLGSNVVDAGQGAADSDTVSYGGIGIAVGVVVTLNDGNGSASGVVADTLGSVENVTGTPSGDDIAVRWNGVSSALRGRDGGDVLQTDDGDALDFANGGAGVDICGRDAGDTLINCP